MSKHQFSRKSYFPYGQTRTQAGRRGLALFSFILLTLGLPTGGVLPDLARAAHAPTVGSSPAEDAVIRQVSVDQAGVITYIKGDGIYTSGRSGGPRRQVAVGEGAPRTGGRFAQFLDVSSAMVDTGPLPLGNELRIVFKATIDGGPLDHGIFIFTENRGVDAVALPGDIAPNTGGGAFSAFPGRALISALGTIMFKATVAGPGASEGLFFVPRGFLAGEATTQAVAVQGEAAPETGRGSYAGFREYTLTETAIKISVLRILKVDLFAYVADVEGGGVPQGLFGSTFVVLGASPLQLELQTSALALVGNNAAGLRGQSTYAGFEDVVLTTPPPVLPGTVNNEVVFRAQLTGGEASEGIFQIAYVGPIPFSFPLASPRVLLGDKAPIPRANVQFAQFGRMVGNNSEQLVFEAVLQGDGPPQGLFLVTLGPLTLMSETLSVGDRAPGTNGGVYSGFGPLSINDDGVIALQASLDGGNVSEAVFSVLAKRGRFVDGVPR